MANSQSSPAKNTDDQLTDIRISMARYLYHWPLFVLVILLTFLGGWFYMQITEPVYELNASILVKDEKKSPQEKSTLQELNQPGSANNAETEIQILTSKRLISQVVKDLQLWATYTSQKGMEVHDLYGKAPFTFQFAGDPPVDLEKTKIEILVKSADMFEIKNFKGGAKASRFGEVINGTLGKWMLTATGSPDQYIGEVVTITLNDPVAVANQYQKILDVRLLDKSAPTIGLFITDKIEKRGKDILNYLIKDYNEATISEEKRKTASTINFLEQRLGTLKTELDQSEQQVESFRSSEGITDIESQSKVHLENLQVNDGKLNEVNVQLNVVNGIEKYVSSTANSEAVPPISGIASETLTALIENLSQLQLKRAALLATTPEGNPIFEPLNQQISSTKASIKTSLHGIRTSLQNTKSQLQSFNNKFESSIRDIPGQERQFIDMKRQQTIKENLYVYLLQKKEELELSNASTLVDARTVDRANLAGIKWPRASLVYTIALIIGLGLPFMLLYFRQSFNNKILVVTDIKQSLPIPLLGVISQTHMKRDSIVRSSLRNITTEQFRSLRVNLNHVYKSMFEIDSPREVTQVPAESGIQGTFPPLYIINGVKSDAATYHSLSRADIKNVCFVNDEADMSRYGLEAMHGVIEVTTHDEQPAEHFSSGHALKEPATIPRNLAVRRNGTKRYPNTKARGRVTLVTSGVSSEGKSFVSSNLAVSIAASQRRTLLVDMNFHRSRVAAIFKLPTSHPGITDFLSSETQAEVIIQSPKGSPNLDIITPGRMSEQNFDLLEHEKLTALIDGLKTSYDEIIIDTPPLHAVPDAMIIAELADVTLYVVRQGHTDKNELEFIKHIHEENKLPQMNIVFNGVVSEKYGQRADKSYYNPQTMEDGVKQLLRAVKSRL